MTLGDGAENAPQEDDKLNIMLVDDSAVIRGAIARILDKSAQTHIIASVANGKIAVDNIHRHNPDIVILDIEMPEMDGITALPKLLEKCPNAKIIMCSTLTDKGATVSIKAMTLGAVDTILKPSARDAGHGSEFEKNMLALIESLGKKKKPHLYTGKARENVQAQATKPALAGLTTDYTLRSQVGVYSGRPTILAIGSSTGGPQALMKVLSHFNNFPIPIIITQHMPGTFTKILAEHIEQNTGIPAFEVDEGMPIEKGKAYVAAGGKHFILKQEDNKLFAHLDDGPSVNFCKPAVDPMFLSAIDIFKQKVLGLILTGMGHDGIGGGEKLNELNARLVAQDPDTSVVWGMPGAVAQKGYCTEVLPLEEIGPFIRKIVVG